MNPDLLFILGIALFALAFPATLAAFSSSDRTFRPVLVCVLLGGGMIVAAMMQSPQGYDLTDVPRIAMDLIR